jgi:NAD(P)-dependent dehydrogenase (short-subunit alcohol dehydrogenase family)
MLKQKVILVTGGSGLLGKVMVDDLQRKGAIPINLDVDVKDDQKKQTLYCDVTDDESIRRAIKKVWDQYQRVDGLVNNAYPRTSDWGNDFEQIDPDSWRQNVDWQLNAYFVFCQDVLIKMKEQGFGSIVNVASIYGVVGNDFTVYEGTDLTPAAAYTAIKGGVINFTRYLASKYGPYGIRVNCVSPGGIFNHQPEKFVENYSQKVPMKRMGNPDDIAPPTSFLLSDEAKYITGHNLIVDGGWTAI